jgi:hypothetical protein
MFAVVQVNHFTVVNCIAGASSKQQPIRGYKNADGYAYLFLVGTPSKNKDQKL